MRLLEKVFDNGISSAAGEESPIFVSLKQSDPSAFGLRMTKNYLMVSF